MFDILSLVWCYCVLAHTHTHDGNDEGLIYLQSLERNPDIDALPELVHAISNCRCSYCSKVFQK